MYAVPASAPEAPQQPQVEPDPMPQHGMTQSFSMSTPPQSPREAQQMAHVVAVPAQAHCMTRLPQPPMPAPPPAPPAARAQATYVSHQPPAQPRPAAVVEQRMVQLQVLVPEPGLRPGQQLAFTAPASGSTGAQQMTVTVNQEVVPGSIVTVQYPAPAHTPMGASLMSSLPEATVQVDVEEDRRQSQILWAVYGSGWLCLCCFMPMTLILWISAGAIYFCKPAPLRAQYRQARTPAWTAAITTLVCCLLAAVAIPVVFVLADCDSGKCNFDFGHHHHHGPEAWKGSGAHHHGPCPFKRLKSLFMDGHKHHHNFNDKVESYTVTDMVNAGKAENMPMVPVPKKDWPKAVVSWQANWEAQHVQPELKKSTDLVI